jgi:hypothetical protein
MSATPDTITEVRVYLTPEEIGRAFANRCDDDQAEILRVIVRELDRVNNSSGAQACVIWTRLFHEMQNHDTAKAIEFLRTILYSLNEDAKRLVEISAVKEP